MIITNDFYSGRYGIMQYLGCVPVDPSVNMTLEEDEKQMLEDIGLT